MKLEDVSKNSILEELEDLEGIEQYATEINALSAGLRDSFWTGITKEVIKKALNDQSALISCFKRYLVKCEEALSKLDSYKEQASILREKSIALRNFENSNGLKANAPYAIHYDDSTERRTHSNLKSQYSSALSKQNEIKQSLIDAFDSYILSGSSGAVKASSTDSRVFNIDKMENNLKDFEDLIKKLRTKYVETYESGYIYSCNNDVINVLKMRISKYFELIRDNNLKIQLKWKEIIKVFKMVYNSTNVANGGNPSGYSKQESIMPYLTIIDESNPFIRYDSIPGKIDNIVNDNKPGDNSNDIIEPEYPNIQIGSSVGNFDVSKGHMTAADAVSGNDVHNLLSQYVNSENSQFKSFAIVNKDGTVSNIERADGMTLQQYCEKYGVGVENVAVDVANKEGVSQAWISVKELKNNQEELNNKSTNFTASNSSTNINQNIAVSGVDKTASEIISQYIDDNSNVRGFAISNKNGSVSNAELANNITLDEYCKKYNVNKEDVLVNLNNKNGVSNTWVTLKELINK